MTTRIDVNDALAALGIKVPEIAPKKPSGTPVVLEAVAQAAEPEPQPVTLTERYTGKITGTLWPDGAKGKTQFALWRKNGEITIVIETSWSTKLYGEFVAPYVAEDRLVRAAHTPMAKAFNARVYDGMVSLFIESRPERCDAWSVQHDRVMTPLWENRDYSGQPLAHTMVALHWHEADNGHAYPTHLVIMDGDRLESVELTRNEGKSPNHPSYTGAL